MNLPEKIYLWLRDLVSKPGERGLSSAGYWQDLLRRKVLGRLAKAEGGLLEIGCGEGLFLSQLSEFNPQLRLFGVERESAVLSDAQRRLKGNVRLVSSDARQLPFKDASFEWAVGVNLFLCVESREALTGILREAARVLRQGARLIVEFRNKDNIFLRLKYKWARYYDSTTKNHPLSTFHKEDVLKILREAGFNVIKTQEIDFPFKGLPAIFILEAVKKGTGYFSSDVEVRNKSSLSPFLPIIGHPIGWDDLAYGLGHSLDRKAEDLFRQSLAGYLGLRHIYFLNSGLSAFYVILEALKKLSPREEVILPAYTAPNLILAIRKAGLKPVLCDISLGDFNSDTEDVLRKITSDTLCVLGVHMFGIPWQDITRLKEKAGADVFVIEDCAQAFGAKIEEKLVALAIGSQTTALWPVGSFSDVAFYSFNRGKNLPAYEGGCIALNSDELAKRIEEEVSKMPVPGALHTASLAFKSLALALSFNPYFYGLLFPFISCFKDNRVAEDFQARAYSLFQSGLGYSLLRKYQQPLQRRFENGMRLLSGLKGIEGIILPRISERIYPVFNRLPIVFKDETKIEAVLRELDEAGIESSRLYLRPLHHIFDLGYKKEDFPNAVFLAKGLLTLPAHPLVKEKDIDKMIRIIRNAVSA